jgi:uncharacterized protein YjiS (DUF1127 family)
MSKALVIQAAAAIGSSRRLGRTVAGLLIRGGEYVVSWNRRVRDRRLLARCDERVLRDIGIDAATVDSESTVSFWRVR